MFSGQGSHYYQMGCDLWESHPVFRTRMERADALVQPLLGRSVLEELYGHPASRPCDDLAVSHPALVMVEHALWATLVSEGIEPDCLWGTSAGEFAAAVAAGIWSLESALATSVEQARQVARSCSPGGMLAVLGPRDLYDRSPVIREHTTLAGVSYDRHFVVSGSTPNLDRVERFLAERNIHCQRLAIPFAFHADGIDAARDAVVRFCHTLPPFKTPRVAYLSGMTAQYLSGVPRAYFWDVLRQPMRFYEGVTRLEQEQASVFVDCGPAGTSANFIKYGLPPRSRSICFPTMTAFHQGRANLEILKKQLALSDTASC
jgi:trans-AT polyketide synthase/acyltransferase/oxidoreductase domain-containing protein